MSPGPRRLTLAAWTVAGLAIGIVTSGDRSRVERDLARVGWETTFDVVVCGSDLAERKPKPGPLLHALERMGVAPGSALYAGDTVDDVVMGKAAGTRTAGVAIGFSPWEALVEAAPTYLYRSLQELAPRRLPLEFQSWVTRMRTPDTLVAALRHMFEIAPDVVRAHWSGQGDALALIHRATDWSERQVGRRLRGALRRLLP